MTTQPTASHLLRKKGIPVYTANHLQFWATVLIGYDFVINYVRTKSSGHADALAELIALH